MQVIPTRTQGETKGAERKEKDERRKGVVAALQRARKMETIKMVKKACCTTTTRKQSRWRIGKLL